MKKILKIVGIILAIFLLAIFIIPIAFEGKILELVKTTANNNLNATVNYEDGSLSIWRNFPKAEVSLYGTTIINKGDFEGDTLVSAKTISLQLPLLQLFSSNSAITITKFTIDEANLDIKVNSHGKANYDIAKSEPTDNPDTSNNTTNPLQFKLAAYTIKNSRISYDDINGKIKLLLDDVNHSGSGDLSAETSTLKTNTSALASFEFDSIAYLNKNTLQLDAEIGIDLNQNKFSFLENKALINQLPLVFDGFVKMNETNQEIDLSFKTPSSDFKNFLAVIPEVYSKNITGVTTTGAFTVDGTIAGIVDETHIPKLNIQIHADNASFKYPDLPKTVEHIHLNTAIVNTTGLVKDTYVDMDTLAFKIDQEVFHAKAKMTDLTTNMKVDAALKGGLNLGHLSQIYPAEAFKTLKGKLSVNVKTKFDSQSIEQKKYQNTYIQGKFDLRKFEFESDELTDKLFIENAGLSFNNAAVNLREFSAKMGRTDFMAHGTIKNLLGFLFNKEDIEGDFALDSNVFAIDDFMVETTSSAKDSTKTTTPDAQIKIPSFLNCTFTAKANTVLYDNITLKDVAGTLIVKDQQATLKNVRSTIFGGNLDLNGMVSTKQEPSTFRMGLDIKSFNIESSFEQLDLLKALAPIASMLNGKLNSTINLAGTLNPDFTPMLSSISGSAMAEILTATFKEKTPLLTKLEENLNFIQLDQLNLNDLKTALNFSNGKVQIDPFTLKYKDIAMEISGGHGFDNTLGYTATMDVPVKYLGKEGAAFLAKLDQNKKEEIIIPIKAIIGGQLKNPSVSTDLKSAMTNLSKQLINQQKEEIKDKVGDKLNELLGGKNTPADSTKVDSIKQTPQEQAKNKATDLLKDLLGKKKKDTVKK
ncbi:AsmA family protein [Flavobacteriaceae bacterium F08102]|nr:AsmA family protein [Flavobacteriaceae bacterium F08102]